MNNIYHMKITKLTTTLIVILLLTSSCSVVKKNGYYQSRTYNTKSVKTKKHQKLKPNIQLVNTHAKTPKPTLNKPVQEITHVPTVNGLENVIHVKRITEKRSFFKAQKVNTDSCDIIILQDGNEISAKITEVGINEVKYKRCDNLTGPAYVIKKSDVFMLKYANGTKEVIQEQKTDNVQTEKAQTPNETKSGNGIGVLVLLIGLIMLLFISILFGAIVMILGIVILAS